MFKKQQNKQERKGKMKWMLCATLLLALAFSGFKASAQDVTYITPDQLSTSTLFKIDADGTYVLAAIDAESGLADPTAAPTTFDGYIQITNGKNVTLYLNGHTLTCSKTGKKIIENKGNLTLYGTYPDGNEGGIIDGYYANNTAIRNCGIYQSGTNTSVYVDGVTIQNCNYNSNGGAISSTTGLLEIRNSVITDCGCTGNGGAVYFTSNVNDNGLLINNTTIQRCTSTASGAAICKIGGKGNFTISNSLIEDCSANTTAGAIHFGNNNATLEVNNTTIRNCQSKGNGGGIYSVGIGTVVFKNNSTIDNCVALNNFGGGIYIGASGKLTMENGLINECIANTGGGIFVNSGAEFTMNGGTISYCYAVKDKDKTYVKDGDPSGSGFVGGGVCLEMSTMNFNGGTIKNCHAATGSGGIHTWTEGTRANLYINGPTCKVTECDAYSYGGCTHVGNGSYCVMKDGEISYNTCHHGSINENGGAFSVGFATGCRFDIEGGKICHNQALAEDGGIGLGGGIFMRQSGSAGGAINITGGEISDNYAANKGGGVYARISVKVDGASILRNEAGVDGGGIFFESTCSYFKFLSGEISGNTAGYNGGGLYFDNFGSNSIELIQGTLEDNTAGNYGGGAYMENSKITFGTGTDLVSFEGNSAAQGGGLYISSTGSTKRDVTINNSSFIENTASDCGGGVYLADNGKGTLYLKQGGTYSTNTAANDGGAIFVNNIKAVEMEDGEFSENEATNGRGGGMYIGTGTITLTSGSASGNKAYDGGAFYANGGKLTINGGYQMSDNVAANDGAGFYANGGAVDISNGAMLNGNYAFHDGGAFYANTGVTVSGTTMTGNNADNCGGAFYVSEGSTIIKENSVINENTAGYGGGMYVDGNLTISDTEILENQAANDGGGVYSNSGLLTIYAGVNVEGNSVQRDGGAFFVGEEGDITMVGGSISGNSADRNGGGIYTKGSFVLGTGESASILSGNEAENNGGAVYVSSTGTITIHNGRIEGNDAAVNGGGIYTEGELLMDAGFIENNHGRYGGGIYLSDPAIATFTNGEVNENTAVNGGGIYVDEDAVLNLFVTAAVQRNVCGNNYDGGMGAGIYQNGTLNVAGTAIIVSGNNSKTLSSITPNNVYLPDEDDFITIVDWTDLQTGTTYLGLQGGNINIGITVPEVPRAVVHSESPTATGHIKDLYEALHEHLSTSILKDDLNKYSAVWADGPSPYNLKDIYFTATWVVGALDLLPEGVERFNNDDLGNAAEVDAYFRNINCEEKLARFMCYVNGLEGYTRHPNQVGQVTEDLYMQKYIWLPIGSDDGRGTYPEGQLPLPYTGKFDGGGHIIAGLRTIGLIGLNTYGLFGRTNGAQISNAFVTRCEFQSAANDTMGIVVGKMVGGKLYYAEGAGVLKSTGEHSILGGLVGYLENATINSCMAMPDMTGATMGGLIGKMVAKGTEENIKNCLVYNCFANPRFNTINTLETSYSGGFIGYQVIDGYQDYANCRLSESYVRLDRDHHILPGAKIGRFAGKQGTFVNMQNVFSPIEEYCGGITEYVYEVVNGDIPVLANYATFRPVSDPGTYYYDPAQDTYIEKLEQGRLPNENDRRLLPQMQAGAYIRNVGSHPNPPVCYWKRTGASEFMASGGNINSDYPVLDFDSVSPLYVHEHVSEFYENGYAPYYIALGSEDGIVLDYCVSLSSMLKRYNYYDNGGTINLFHNVDNSQGAVKITDDDVRIYIDEGITILQGPNSYLNAVSYQTLELGSVDYWHTFSSVMGNKFEGELRGPSKIGIKYNKMGKVPHNFSNDPCEVFLDQGNDSEPNSNSTLFPYDSPIDSIDFYCFYEPEYHWINFKRNSLSHWHMDNYDQNIHYENETCLIPGKGYLLALCPEQKIYEYGVLNCGDINTSTRPEDLITYTEQPGGQGYPGYNLLGNPYQAYLDFDKFADENAGLWSGESGLDKSFYMFDAHKNAYVGYHYKTEPSTGSTFPSKWAAPHQGFFIVKSNTAANAPTTARFIETGEHGMCSLTGDGKLLRGENPAYKLVNLRVTDMAGHADIASVEFGRPATGGMAKQKALRTGDFVIYTNLDDTDYAMLFLDGDVKSLPLYFDCTEGGTYTLSWNTANGQFVRLALVDNLTGVSTDCLSHDSYTFEANPSDFKSRFKLVFQYDFDDEEDESANGTANFAFVSNGDLIVNGQGYMEIMDVNGHVVASERLDDSQSRVSMPQVAAGIYIVRLGEKVQKIVIR